MTSFVATALGGAAAGAAGTTALNAVTYLDMAWRGRPASSTPEDTVEKLAHTAGVEVPGDDETRSNRLAGLGPLTGPATGLRPRRGRGRPRGPPRPPAAAARARGRGRNCGDAGLERSDDRPRHHR